MAQGVIKNELSILQTVATAGSNVDLNINRLNKTGHVVEIIVRALATATIPGGSVIFTLPYKPVTEGWIVDSTGMYFYLNANGNVTTDTNKSYSSDQRICYFLKTFYITID